MSKKIKPWTWEDLAHAIHPVQDEVVKEYGLLGAVAIETAGAITGITVPHIDQCAVHKFLRSKAQVATSSAAICEQCPLDNKDCSYKLGKQVWIDWYSKLYKKAKHK